MTQVIVTEEALRDMVREALDNKGFAGWSSNDEGHANVNPTVDPSAMVTDPINPSFTPQDKTELGIAVGQLVKNLPDTDMPGIYNAVKDAIDSKTEKEQEADMEKKAMQGGTQQVEEAVRVQVREALASILTEEPVTVKKIPPGVHGGEYMRRMAATRAGLKQALGRPAEPEEDDEEGEEAAPKRRHSYKDTALGGGMAASFEEIAKSMGFSVAGAKQAIDKAIEKLKFLQRLSKDDRIVLVMSAMNAYIEKLSRSGELTPADVQLLHDHPAIVQELDGFRDFLTARVGKARKGKKPTSEEGDEGDLDEADGDPKPGDEIRMSSVGMKAAKPTKPTKPAGQKAKSMVTGANVDVDWNGMDESRQFLALELNENSDLHAGNERARLLSAAADGLSKSVGYHVKDPKQQLAASVAHKEAAKAQRQVGNLDKARHHNKWAKEHAAVASGRTT